MRARCTSRPFEIQLHNSTREVTSQLHVVWISSTIRQFLGRTIRARKPQLRRTTAHNVEAQIFAGHHLLVGGLHFDGVNSGVASAIETKAMSFCVVHFSGYVTVESE
jgi:hypothetical protein